MAKKRKAKRRGEGTPPGTVAAKTAESTAEERQSPAEGPGSDALKSGDAKSEVRAAQREPEPQLRRGDEPTRVSESGGLWVMLVVFGLMAAFIALQFVLE